MGASEALCPNCGYALKGLRQQRQQVGANEVVLYWAVCARCRHVALYQWAYVEPVDGDSGLEREERPVDVTVREQARVDRQE
jgi:hypothetical protein